MTDPVVADTAVAGGGVGLGAILTWLFNSWRASRGDDAGDKRESQLRGEIKAVDDKVDYLALKLAGEYLPKKEVIDLHLQMLGKFDTVIERLGDIRAELARKADKP